MFLTAEIVGVTSLSLVALSVVLEAAGSSSRLSEARDDPHLNSKRIDRLSALLASVTHRDHTDTHTHTQVKGRQYITLMNGVWVVEHRFPGKEKLLNIPVIAIDVSLLMKDIILFSHSLRCFP